MRWDALKLDLGSLVVNTSVHEYATLESGAYWLPFGSAADCFHARSLLGQVRDVEQFPCH